ncbi:MAG: NAD(P)-dependent oxidoreductase [Pigmentiphaga sp.]|nr:NAD(P)-dependent oxidoreductase [Pigmentiphaga sp.]
MTQRVLVLGAGGYVGRHVVAALRHCGWATPVPVLRRPGSAGEGGLVLDATDASALAAALRNVDAVVNCVAGSPATIQAGAQALRNAMASHGSAIRLVHFSSMAVYGPAIGRVDETAPMAEGLGGYAGAKVAAERLLAEFGDAIMLRPGCIYGRGSPQWSVRIERLLRAGRIGDLGAAGDGCSNLVHIDDVVQAVLAALRRSSAGASRIFNLAMPAAPTWNDYFVAYARCLGAVPVPRISQRRLACEGRILAPLLKIGEIILRGEGARLPPPIPPSLLRLWAQDIRLDAAAATDQLAMRWLPLAEGLTRAATAHSQKGSPCD